MLPLIALEEHFFARDELLPSNVANLYSEQLRFLPQVAAKLHDLDKLRLEDMRNAGVTLQIISHAPGLSSSDADTCRKVNDYLADAIKGKEKVFRGFASLPMSAPAQAAKELKRCVQELGFVGATIDNHITDYGATAEETTAAAETHYDAESFWPVFAAAEQLDVPLYLHPTFPAPASRARYVDGGFVRGAGMSMGTSGWGWHAECGRHLLRLFAAGLFDEFPRLRLVVGHFGEMVPFMLERICALSVRWGERRRDFATVWRENVWITTSGVWAVSPMATILRNTDLDKIMFSIDWPFQSSGPGKQFWEELESSGLIDKKGMEQVGWRNAMELFKLDEKEVIEGAKEFGGQ